LLLCFLRQRGEAIELRPPEGLEELGERAQPVVVGAIETALSIAANSDEAGVTEKREVLRDAGIAELELVGELTDRPFVSPDETENLLPPGLGNELKRIHQLILVFGETSDTFRSPLK
jgi:hypothetical protein